MYDDIRIDLLGKKFGDLTVIGYEQSEHKWICECSCGNVVKVYGQHLRVGDTKSCGCRYGLRNSAFRSYIEMEIYKFIKDNFTGKIVTNNRGVLSNNKEIDIYIPDLKVGIEVNGDYWHNDEHVEINYHKNKVIEALAKGVRLIHIYEHEWVSSQECIKYLLLNILNKSEVVYARNTVVKEIDKETAKTFLNENHLQGYVNSSINIALYENNNLSAVMTFDKPRFNRREEYEVIRLSYRKGINIVGGTEKMFKYFLDKYKPNSIITYASMDKFTGDVYKRLKFNNIGETKPGYVWSRDGIVLSRYKTMKKNLINKGLGTEEQTEDSIMKSMNYNKIYNSGNKIFIWNKNNNKGD